MHKFKIIAQITTCELRIEQGLTDPFSVQSEGDRGKEESIQDGAEAPTGHAAVSDPSARVRLLPSHKQGTRGTGKAAQ